MNDPDPVKSAVRHFWRTRLRQGRKQGAATGVRYTGNRTLATGGKQLDGFTRVFKKLLLQCGIPQESIHTGRRAEISLPGFFRPTKQWDLVVVVRGSLLAALEFKSLCGPSFGNNYNNRVEEAIGNATDIWTAYREGAFALSPRPFVGYLLLLEDALSSVRPVRTCERHFPVLEEFRGASYSQRCQESLRRLIRERCYDATCLILSSRQTGPRGDYHEPAPDLAFDHLSRLMCNQVVALMRSL